MGTTSSISERTPRQQARSTLPLRGGHPRPIACRLQSRDRSGLPAKHGARYAKECGSKSAQNGNRENTGRQSFLQGPTGLPQAPPPSALLNNNLLNERILWDPLWGWRWSQSHKETCGMEWSGWALSFSKYSANFRPNEQGAESLLTHSVKV